MFANRFTALLDASVLTDVAKRDLIFTLAYAEMYRFRWTAETLEEAVDGYRLQHEAAGRSEQDASNNADALRERLIDLFPEAMIIFPKRPAPRIPDLDCERTQKAFQAAVLCRASVFVTDQPNTYETQVFESISVELKSADAFLADAIDLDQVRAATAIKRLRARFKADRPTAEQLLDIWEERHGLVKSVGLLRPYQELI